MAKRFSIEDEEVTDIGAVRVWIGWALIRLAAWVLGIKAKTKVEIKTTFGERR